MSSRRGVAQPGSAPASGAGGRKFESSRPDQNIQGVTASAVTPFLYDFFCASVFLTGDYLSSPMEKSISTSLEGSDSTC